VNLESGIRVESQNTPPAQVLELQIEVEPANTPQILTLDASQSSPLEGR
jgi:hypothetical protein